MATFKEALTTSLTNFAKSIAKTYPKTANIVDNLLSTDSTLPLSAKQGNVLQTQIDTLNSNLNKCPVNKFIITHNVSTKTTDTSTVTLEEGVYIITQAHPYGYDSIYLLKCISGYTGSIVAIINDPNAELTIDKSCALTITTVKGDGSANFRWWHIIKISGLNGLNV